MFGVRSIAPRIIVDFYMPLLKEDEMFERLVMTGTAYWHLLTWLNFLKFIIVMAVRSTFLYTFLAYA